MSILTATRGCSRERYITMLWSKKREQHILVLWPVMGFRIKAVRYSWIPAHESPRRSLLYYQNTSEILSTATILHYGSMITLILSRPYLATLRSLTVSIRLFDQGAQTCYWQWFHTETPTSHATSPVFIVLDKSCNHNDPSTRISYRDVAPGIARMSAVLVAVWTEWLFNWSLLTTSYVYFVINWVCKDSLHRFWLEISGITFTGAICTHHPGRLFSTQHAILIMLNLLFRCLIQLNHVLS